MKEYSVKGMSCAACSARVEKAVLSVAGVTECNVSLLTNSMAVEGTADSSDIVAAVKKAGYKAKPKNEKDGRTEPENEEASVKARLISSVLFLLVLMYFSMGHMMFGFPLPSFLEGNYIAVGLVQMILAAVIMIINQKFFINGFKGLIHRAPNMDTLVALGAAASFVWSVYVLFAMTGAVLRGEFSVAADYADEFYFESAGMILTLITLGKTLEAKSKGKTTNALKSLMKLAPDTATVLRNGDEVKIPAKNVAVGDIFTVRPGESIPVDGVVLEGMSAVNESVLTGESIPADKSIGDSVSAATMNQSGFLKCRAVRVGEDTLLAGIIKTVSSTAAEKAPIAKVADKVSGVFVPAVITVSVIVFLAWLFIGRTFGYALARGISVLVISCPCALGLATPVAIMVGSGVGAKNGILFKTAVSLEQTGKIKNVVFDKTGTITKGDPSVTDVLPCEGISEKKLLAFAASLESKSEHPLAKAVVKKAREEKTEIFEVAGFKNFPGNGLTANAGGLFTAGGSVSFIEKTVEIPDKMKKKAKELAEDGKTPLLFAGNSVLLGIIAVADTVKPEAPWAIAKLKKMDINVYMLTGDNEKTAEAIASAAGIDNVIAGVLPEGKKDEIQKLSSKSRTAMVGDGINDAPALTAADVGIAIGSGTDIAIDAADVVLLKSRLTDVCDAIALSRKVLRNIHENLFWAFIYNVIGIPLAAGCFVKLGLTLNPMFGAAAMSLSSVCVVSNALRINLFKSTCKGENQND